VPRNYLSKILHSLARSGFLVSSRGPGGGFVLPESSRSTPLMAIIELFDPSEPQDRCFLGRPQCRDDDPCPAHAKWGDIKSRILCFLTETTLEELARDGLPPITR
jgi:Rrf2 family protein